jgi:hypothetical protein
VAIHPDLEPLAFLLGRWEGAGIGGYPTIESFRFGQEISFSHNGKPFLIYTSRTWRLDEEGQIGPPLGTESGYWRPRPDSQVEVMLAHPTGIVEIYLGEITGTRIEMATDVVARTATAKEVTAGHRLYGLVGSGGPADQDLAYAYDMAAVGQELQPHLSAQLKRVSSGGQQGEQNKSPGDLNGTLSAVTGPTGQGRPARGLGVCQVLAGRRPTGRHAGG